MAEDHDNIMSTPCSGSGGRCDTILGCVSISPTFSGNVSVRYKPYAYTPQMAQVTRNIIKLPKLPLNNNKENIIVSELKAGASVQSSVYNEYFSLSFDNSSLIIKEEAFSNTSTYYISYVPAFDVTYLVPKENRQNQQLSIPSITSAPQESKLTFNYTYQDNRALNENKYYSPICKGYRLELS